MLQPVTISPALTNALNVLPLSSAEREILERKIDFAAGIIPNTSLAMSQVLARISRKRSTTLAELFQAFQQWAEKHLRAKSELVLLHAAHGNSPLLAGAQSNIGVTIVCNSRWRKQTLSQASEFLAAAVFGYYRIPISFQVVTATELPQTFFERAVILIHGSQKHFNAMQNGTRKALDS
jgi:hypothetical protein